jgi:hypothetical protein
MMREIQNSIFLATWFLEMSVVIYFEKNTVPLFVEKKRKCLCAAHVTFIISLNLRTEQVNVAARL